MFVMCVSVCSAMGRLVGEKRVARDGENGFCFLRWPGFSPNGGANAVDGPCVVLSWLSV